MESLSIHPRNWKTTKDGKKKNTCAPSSLNKRMERAIAGMEKHLKNHPRDAKCQMRISNAKSRMK